MSFISKIRLDNRHVQRRTGKYFILQSGWDTELGRVGFSLPWILLKGIYFRSAVPTMVGSPEIKNLTSLLQVFSAQQSQPLNNEH